MPFTSRTFLKCPAWFWIGLPPVLLLTVVALGPPTPRAEPEEVRAIFRDPVLFTPDGAVFHVVPPGGQTSIKPLWVADREVTQHSDVECLTGTSLGTILGFYRQTMVWHYALHASRRDDAWRDHAPGLWTLPPEDLVRVRPLVIAELNHRSGDERWGDRLASILDEGVEETSYMSLQNGVILLGWLSLVPALWGIKVMFWGTPPEPMNWPPGS
jgi:hypothetical protein